MDIELRDSIVSAVLFNTHCDVLTAQKCASDIMGFIQRRPDQKGSCSHDPTKTVGPIGLYHCPECGDMVVTGVPHPIYIKGKG